MNTMMTTTRQQAAFKPPQASYPPQAGILQRQCVCGKHTMAGGQCAECSKKKVMPQRKLTMGALNDSLEREADRVAEQILAAQASPAVSGTISSIQRDAGRSSEESQEVPASIDQVLASAGRPLEPVLRQDMEQRFGHDFSKVRVHLDSAAEQSALDIDAKAYTVGHHIVFGTGRYAPASMEGLHLLAHELTHVVQQSGAGSTARRQVQRAPVYYRQLTWKDFQGKAVESAPESAGILSLFELPGFAAAASIKDTKTRCKLGKTASTFFAATKELDPAQADMIKAYMDPSQSWVKKRFQDDGTLHCSGVATRCERDFDQSAATVTTNCERTVKDCEDSFQKRKGERQFTIGSKRLIVSRVDQCRPMLFKPCQNELMKDAHVTVGATTVRAKDNCRKVLLPVCMADEKVQKADLLKHEQGHFDITHTLANKARPNIKEKAKTVRVTEKQCGKDAAEKAADTSYDKLYSELKQVIDDWLAVKEKAHEDYDAQTGHGLNAVKQKSWEADIQAGLKKYEPAALSTAAPVKSLTAPGETRLPMTPPTQTPE